MLTKDQIDQIKVGDKFTVEFEAVAIGPSFINTTTQNTIRKESASIFLSHTPKPVELVVGMRVPIWKNGRPVLTATEYLVIIAIHGTKAWVESDNSLSYFICDLAEIRKRFELLPK